MHSRPSCTLVPSRAARKRVPERLRATCGEIVPPERGQIPRRSDRDGNRRRRRRRGRGWGSGRLFKVGEIAKPILVTLFRAHRLGLGPRRGLWRLLGEVSELVIGVLLRRSGRGSLEVREIVVVFHPIDNAVVSPFNAARPFPLRRGDIPGMIRGIQRGSMIRRGPERSPLVVFVLHHARLCRA